MRKTIMTALAAVACMAVLFVGLGSAHAGTYHDVMGTTQSSTYHDI